MTPQVTTENKLQIFPRILLDFALTHAAAIIALGLPVVYESTVGSGTSAALAAQQAREYYLKVFVPLSLVFPLAFLLNGFYSGAYGREGRYSPRVLLLGVLSSAVLFALGSQAMSAREPAAPSINAALCAVILATAVTIRLVKLTVPNRNATYLRERAPDSPGVRPILVIGGAGYIGTTLVRRLLDQGYHVRILDSLIYGDFAIRDLRSHPNLELRIGDCRNMKTVIDAVSGVDSIVHLAAIVGDPACDLDHKTALEINYAATRMIVEVAKGHRISRFIFASSCSVYGATDEMMYEHSPTAPLSVYAHTKIDSEESITKAADDTFHPTIIRLATVFGNSHRPRFDLVVNLLTAKAHTDGVITIYNGEQWRPFIHVADVARGIETLLKAPLTDIGGQIFNLGDSRLNYTLTDVADKIRAVFPNTTVTHVDNNDRRNYRVSFEHARSVLGFECKFDLDYGIQDLKRALEDGRIPDYTDTRYHNQRFLQARGSLASRAPIDSKVMAAFASAGTPGEQALTRA